MIFGIQLLQIDQQSMGLMCLGVFVMIVAATGLWPGCIFVVIVAKRSVCVFVVIVGCVSVYLFR